MLEEGFYFLGDTRIYVIVIIVFSKERKELGQPLFVIIIFSENLDLLHYLHEITQDHGKSSDSAQKSHWNHGSFGVTDWIKVAESNGGKWSKWIVDHDEIPFEYIVLLYPKLPVETRLFKVRIQNFNWDLYIVCNIWENEEWYSKKVSTKDYEAYNFQGAEPIFKADSKLYFGVVLYYILT